jgi:hypothetical protein
MRENELVVLEQMLFYMKKQKTKTKQQEFRQFILAYRRVHMFLFQICFD